MGEFTVSAVAKSRATHTIAQGVRSCMNGTQPRKRSASGGEQHEHGHALAEEDPENGAVALAQVGSGGARRRRAAR